MSKKVVPISPQGPGVAGFSGKTSPLQLADALSNLVGAYYNYQSVLEQETTKRQAIESWRETTLAQIQSQKHIVMTAIERSFAERREIYERMFAIVDQAIESNDNTRLAVALQCVTEVAKSNPFSALTDLQQTQQSLVDRNQVWKL